MARSSGRWGLGLALVAAGIALDQFTKWLVLQAWSGIPRDFGPVRIAVAYNPGVSFSQLAGLGSAVVLVVGAVCVGVAVAMILAGPRYRPALGLVLGGALGNLIDRLRYDGTVLDYIGVWRWPSFNVADALIAVGTVWLVVLMLRAGRE
ncbi:MAG: signal peptidase II [Thermoleophilia bacterium]